MATKPTDRILDWASGGTATDPGGAKEATGWVVSERPPAFWWNWILNSFGQWLSWSEDSIDDVETNIVALEIGKIHAFGNFRSGASPTIDFNGAGLSSVGAGSTNSVDLDLSVTFNSEPEMCVVATSEDSLYHVSVSPQDTNTIRFFASNVNTGSVIDLQSTSLKIHVTVLGVLA